jgi:hypothetical protein
MRSEPRGSEKPVTQDPDQPVYQVTFWERLAEPADLPEKERGFGASVWRVHDAEVTEVLAWAKERATTQPYMVHVATPPEDGHSELIRLYGQDPTISPFEDSEPFQLAD